MATKQHASPKPMSRLSPHSSSKRRRRLVIRIFGTGIVFCLGMTWYGMNLLDMHAATGRQAILSSSLSQDTWLPQQQQDKINKNKNNKPGVRSASKRGIDRLVPPSSQETPNRAVLAEQIDSSSTENCGRGSLCHTVGTFIQSRRDDILRDVAKSEWAWFLPSIADYYQRCIMVNTSNGENNNITIVELGEPSSGYGASAQFMMQQQQHRFNHPKTSTIHYHVYDSFTITKGMQRVFRHTAPKATTVQLSQAWAESMMRDLNVGIATPTRPGDRWGQRLHVHQTDRVAEELQKQFLDSTLDAVYIDGISTLQHQEHDTSTTIALLEVIVAKLRPGGSLILGHNNIVKDDHSMAILQQARITNSLDIRNIEQFQADTTINRENDPIVRSCRDDHPVLRTLNVSKPQSRSKVTTPGLKIASTPPVNAQFTFHKEASEVTGLSPSENCSENADAVTAFCSDPKNNPRVTECMRHTVELGHLRHQTNHDESNVPQTKCKTLWIAGFHEGLHACHGREMYAREYSAALQSALDNAAESLQPVLLLGRYGLETENSRHLSPIGQWAQKNGAKVIVWPRLSFQEHVDLSAHGIMGPNRYQYEMGPFLRLDIPKIVAQYGLMDDHSICPDHVLYTDPDVLFTGNITPTDMKILKQGLHSSNAIVSYGREYDIGPNMHNTGVMLMNVKAFDAEWPKILKYTLNKQSEGRPFPLHDQVMLNNYFDEEENALKRSLLPLFWNWKAYWKLDPSQFSDVKILHFHGPKPNKVLDDIAFCQTEMLPMIWELYQDYEHLVLHGICCDQGRTAYHALKLFERYTAPSETICPSKQKHRLTVSI
ncbi:hypothetical protein IV203_032092 [Nitzschia inconspicua]|uniref:Uncharacterized protein n=1 Tax=Nitzschia inconspicua TaxID=303405 RepID=A0A9K3K745_9STRA|nr:hypothetical protein IV203_011288 [Nitzschia inconspicua]KAG7369349.1 hypothetical protein IV203_032092 [Nitzschia inconspicua]